jgi:ATP-binding cassette, subfamily B, bacterial
MVWVKELINLLLRFIKPASEEILLDGTDINEFRVKDYKGLISVVSQDL